MGDKKRIVLTGACGRISNLLLPALRERYDLVLLDVKTTDREGLPVEGVEIADLTEGDRETYRRHFAGADAVVHNGFVGTAGSKNPFEAEMRNVQMAHNIYQVAWEEKVRRVVMTSSNHAADYYEDLILDGKMDVVTPEMQNRSYGYYGWAKDAYEHLGFVFALGRMHDGRGLENAQIRIGAPRDMDLNDVETGDMRRVRRCLGAYISQRDLQQLYVKSIEAADISDENGVPFQVFYGISGNSHGFWSIANARKIIGYEPQDDSSIRFYSDIGKHVNG
jgi:hypothetical protein